MTSTPGSGSKPAASILLTTASAVDLWSPDWVESHLGPIQAETFVRFVRGARSRTWQTLIAEFASSLQLPPYIGPTPDALFDSLLGMRQEWWTQGFTARLVLVYEGHQLLIDEPAGSVGWLLDIIGKVSDASREPLQLDWERIADPCPVRWVLQVPGSDVQRMLEESAAVGVDLLRIV